MHFLPKTLLLFRRRLAKIVKNWRKSSKIGENRQKLAKIVKNWRKSVVAITLSPGLRSELSKIDRLISELENSTDIVNNVDAWLPEMKTYFNDHIGLAEDGTYFLHTKSQFW
jgi:hypothetical protein